MQDAVRTEKPDVVLVVMTHPDELAAGALARELVESRLAACVQLAGRVKSTYRWQGAVETAEELRLEAMTTADRLPELARFVRERHPYVVPELIALPVGIGLGDYLSWVHESTRPG